MIPLDLADVADVVGGDLRDDADAARVATSVTIDSRSAGEGTLFVALPGERADGHDYIDAAVAAGASGYLFDETRDVSARGGIAVDDPADALLGLGAWMRTSVDPLVVAVTGSAGKTTTKDLLRAALSSQRRVVANPGSYNNELGVPLTCCELQSDTEMLVAEVGARGAGHIAAMALVLQPDVSVVTTVAAAHLEMFVDLDGVAKAKRELVEALSPDGVAVLNADDSRVLDMASAAPGRVVTYGRRDDADYRATDVVLDADARARFRLNGVDVRLPLPGEHNIGNALAALAVADVTGVDLQAAAAAIGEAAVSRWRMELSRTAAGVTVLNDAYNANPASMAAALRTLASMQVAGRRWAVLGQMAELGAGADTAHREIGQLCASLQLDGLVVVGSAASEIAEGASGAQLRVEAVAAPADAVEVLQSSLQSGDAVLVKASRAAGLETVAQALTGGGRA